MSRHTCGIRIAHTVLHFNINRVLSEWEIFATDHCMHWTIPRSRSGWDTGIHCSWIHILHKRSCHC